MYQHNASPKALAAMQTSKRKQIISAVFSLQGMEFKGDRKVSHLRASLMPNQNKDTEAHCKAQSGRQSGHPPEEKQTKVSPATSSHGSFSQPAWF